MLFLSPKNFSEYELIDCGGFSKLERFGKYYTIRPEPQALWTASQSLQEWRSIAHTEFISRSASNGEWKMYKTMPLPWQIQYRPEGASNEMIFRLAPTSFKHVGVFPEQAVNWDFIYNSIKQLQHKGIENPRVLNLFAYTGGASLAARLAGADVTHLDSVRQVVTWARENMDLSSLDHIRWLVEDAMTYVQREVKRGKKYHGIILDPPAYGHGTDGKKWKLEEMIEPMMKMVSALLDKEASFLLLNTYSLGYSSLVAKNLLQAVLPKHCSIECGELCLPTQHGMHLPLGVFGRAVI